MLIQVSKHRKNNLFSVTEIDARGITQTKRKSLCVAFGKGVADAVDVGQIWEVDGKIEQRKFQANGFTVKEDQLTAETAEFIKPNTALMETWLRKNIDGVGQVKARKLARMPLLERAIESGDPTNFLGLSDVSREQLFRKFHGGYAEAIKWLSLKLPVVSQLH